MRPDGHVIACSHVKNSVVRGGFATRRRACLQSRQEFRPFRVARGRPSFWLAAASLDHLAKNGRPLNRPAAVSLVLLLKTPRPVTPVTIVPRVADTMNAIGTSARLAVAAAARSASGSSSGVWARRLAKTPLRRNPRHNLSTSAVLFKKQVGPPALDPYAPSALNAVLARLSLPPTPEMRESLMACLTHPSFNIKDAGAAVVDGQEALPEPDANTNELLSALGNRLLGLFASESLSAKYPHIPSAALAQAVTYYVGPLSLVAVGRELGIATQGNHEERAAARANAVLAMPIRWKRNTEIKLFGEEETPTDAAGRVQARKDEERKRRKNSWEEGVASVVRAFIGLIYQERVSWA